MYLLDCITSLFSIYSWKYSFVCIFFSSFVKFLFCVRIFSHNSYFIFVGRKWTIRWVFILLEARWLAGFLFKTSLIFYSCEFSQKLEKKVLKSIANWLFRGRKGISNHTYLWLVCCAHGYLPSWHSFWGKRDVSCLFGEGFYLRIRYIEGSASEAFPIDSLQCRGVKLLRFFGFLCNIFDWWFS